MILQEIGIIFLICAAGEGFSYALPFPFPGSVISMLLLLVLLFLKVIREEHIGAFSDFLLKNMAFFFLPAGVGIIDSLDILKANALSFVAVIVISFILTFLATGVTVKWIISFKKGEKSYE